MHLMVNAVYFHEDGLTIEWRDGSETGKHGITTHATSINERAIEDWEHVGYYYKELFQDAHELIDAYLKYQRGAIPM